MPIGALVAVPDLQSEGIARLLSRQAKNVLIRFLASGAEMTQEERRVMRYCLLPATRVRVKLAAGEVEGEIAARAVQRDAGSGLMVYVLRGADGSEQAVREDAIVAVPAPRDAAEQLVTAAFHDLRPHFAPAGSALPSEPWGAQTFCAREELLRWRDGAWSAAGGVIGLAGARVRALPHQLITARRVLGDRQVRFLLADEVGLGKTIEAGLIMQSLLAMRPQMRVLIVVPGALISQWFLELYVKFGGRTFLMLDQERLRNHAGNPWKDEQFVLASSRALEEMDGKSALRFAQSSWDLLIVDECHRMQPGGILYKRLALVSKASPHVLLLSATPARSHVDAYLALLALLQPQIYRLGDTAAFAAKLAAHERVVALLTRTAEASSGDAAALAVAWRGLLGADELLAARAAALGAATVEGFIAAREQLMAYVREHYQLDHRLIRHRRQVLARLSHASGVQGLDLAVRSHERVSYQPDAPELAVRSALGAYRQTLLAAFASASLVPPRLAHWLLQLELALGADPLVLDRLLAMRAAVLEDPAGFADYRERVVKGETTAQVLRSDLSENEIAAHVAISAACHADATVESEVLAALQSAVAAWNKRIPARAKALIKRLKEFWKENPQEKVLIFTGHGLAVKRLAGHLAEAFADEAVETFGGHQDTVEREESARRFRDDDHCPLLVCDPLGGEGRNFQFVSVVVHHDLPWSVAAVEQRIGRVDRLGRDGEVPSWVLAPDHAECVDGAWAEVLERAVGVFTASSSGLEFVADELETRALAAVFSGGAAALRALVGELGERVTRERDVGDARADELFHEAATTYAEAARLAQALEQTATPKDAVCRWIRSMGGSARRDEEPPRAFHLRTRYHQQAEAGVFERDAALARPDLAYFAFGNGVIDRLLDDAANARWCATAAWRRQPGVAVKNWEGVRASFELGLDLAALAAADLPLDCLRRLLLVAAPVRQVVFVRSSGERESDEAVLAALAPPFDVRHGDSALSLSASREIWTRPLLGGKLDQVVKWQEEMRRAIAGARAQAEALLPIVRDAGLATLDRGFAASVAVARAQAAAAAARFPESHPDALRARAEAEDEERQALALHAVLAGARFDLVGLAYIVVA